MKPEEKDRACLSLDIILSDLLDIEQVPMWPKLLHPQQQPLLQGLPGTPTAWEPLWDASCSTFPTVKTYLSNCQNLPLLVPSLQAVAGSPWGSRDLGNNQMYIQDMVLNHTFCMYLHPPKS